MIEVENISKSFGKLNVLNNVSFKIKKGEIVSITGTSGAGKTTLLQIIGTLDKADKGKVIYNSTNVMSFQDKELSDFRNRKIGFVFQFHHLLPEFSALENILIPAYIAKREKSEATEMAFDLMKTLGISDRHNHKPSELSGGEQQRVAIARALINNPELVLADEPSGNLDENNSLELHKLFYKLREKYNQTFIIVTHDNSLADNSDRKLILSKGEIIS